MKPWHFGALQSLLRCLAPLHGVIQLFFLLNLFPKSSFVITPAEEAHHLTTHSSMRHNVRHSWPAWLQQTPVHRLSPASAPGGGKQTCSCRNNKTAGNNHSREPAGPKHTDTLGSHSLLLEKHPQPPALQCPSLCFWVCLRALWLAVRADLSGLLQSLQALFSLDTTNTLPKKSEF